MDVSRLAVYLQPGKKKEEMTVSVGSQNARREPYTYVPNIILDQGVRILRSWLSLAGMQPTSLVTEAARVGGVPCHFAAVSLHVD